MAKQIFSVGISLASEDVKHVEFAEKISLLDADIVLFNPNIDEYIDHRKQFQGKPCLNDSDSFRLKESLTHWKRELKQAADSGKTVVIFLSALQELYIATGDEEFSGTGRNRQRTRIVDLINNYKSIPLDLKPIAAVGSSVKLVDRIGDFIAPYWADFGGDSSYQVLLGNSELSACLVTKNGSKIVGALTRSDVSEGSILVLPSINFDKDEFYDEVDDEIRWTDAGTRFSAKMIAAMVALDSALRGSADVTPEPAWAADPVFSLAAEQSVRLKLFEVEQELEKQQLKKDECIRELQSIGKLRGLLYEKGKPLEHAILDALRIIGFKATSYKDSSSEFDAVFECEQGRLLGEAEGKDTKAINVDKLRQLGMNIQEDLQREEVTEPAKGVLFGNGYRLLPPERRNTEFTEKCIKAAQAGSTALISTRFIFSAAQYLSANDDTEYAAACRLAILNGSGLVALPIAPVQSSDVARVEP